MAQAIMRRRPPMTPPKMAPIGACVIGWESAGKVATSGVDVEVDSSSTDGARGNNLVGTMAVFWIVGCSYLLRRFGALESAGRLDTTLKKGASIHTDKENFIARLSMSWSTCSGAHRKRVELENSPIERGQSTASI
jgi:hypothetical protein